MMKFKSNIIMLLISFLLIGSVNGIDINAEQVHSSQTEIYLVIEPGSEIIDPDIPQGPSKKPSKEKDKLKPLPATGMPANGFMYNVSYVLVIIGILFIIKSKEEGDENAEIL